MREEHGSLACCRPKGGVRTAFPKARVCGWEGKMSGDYCMAKAEGQRQGALAQGHTNE